MGWATWGRAVAGAAVGLGLATIAVPAQAQFFGFWGARAFSYAPAYAPGLSAGEIASIVADEGMRLVSRPYRNRNVYVVDARDMRGWPHRLIIDADSGQIVQSFGQGQSRPQRLARPEPPLTSGPDRRLARAIPEAPYVVPGIGGEDQPAARPAPKTGKKPPVIARTPIETRPLEPPAIAPLVPQTSVAPVKPGKKPPALARTPVEATPLEAPPAKKIVPQMLPGYAPPTAVEAPLKASPAPVVAAPLNPVQLPETPVRAREVEPAAVSSAPKPAVNDVPVAPLYDAPARPPAGKVNDVPVAPLD